jgi:hypothetical protein
MHPWDNGIQEEQDELTKPLKVLKVCLMVGELTGVQESSFKELRGSCSRYPCLKQPTSNSIFFGNDDRRDLFDSD